MGKICPYCVRYTGRAGEQDYKKAAHYYDMAECLFYYRLIDGDFYQKRSLERVIKMEEKIRKESLCDGSLYKPQKPIILDPEGITCMPFGILSFLWCRAPYTTNPDYLRYKRVKANFIWQKIQ